MIVSALHAVVPKASVFQNGQKRCECIRLRLSVSVDRRCGSKLSETSATGVQCLTIYSDAFSTTSLREMQRSTPVAHASLAQTCYSSSSGWRSMTVMFAMTRASAIVACPSFLVGSVAWANVVTAETFDRRSYPIDTLTPSGRETCTPVAGSSQIRLPSPKIPTTVAPALMVRKG